jgi:hypothetical protein
MMLVALLPLGDGAQTKSPETLGALNILLQYSNDITNPVKRLYATTSIDFAASSLCKYGNTISNQQKNFRSISIKHTLY